MNAATLHIIAPIGLKRAIKGNQSALHEFHARIYVRISDQKKPTCTLFPLSPLLEARI
jgi:hypothetical protein